MGITMAFFGVSALTVRMLLVRRRPGRAGQPAAAAQSPPLDTAPGQVATVGECRRYGNEEIR
jgi:hypothetical protein